VLQDIDECLAGVASRRELGARHDAGQLAAQKWDVDRVGAVRRRREKTKEALLAEDIALGVEALDGDVVEITGPMHRRARRCLGHHQKLRAPRIRPELGTQGRKALSELLVLSLAQYAPTRSADDLQRILALYAGSLVPSA